MIYDKMLKQINTVFPKLQLKPPSKKSTVRSLIQQKQIVSFTANDIAQVRNKETAEKAINKLIGIVSAWLKVIQSNEKSRQEYTMKPVNMGEIEQMEYLIRECRQIQGKSQFVQFVSEKAIKLYQKSMSRQPTSYRETYTLKQLQFYNTISEISQAQYFLQLQQLQQSLSIYQKLLQNQLHNLDHLQQLHNMLQNDELFKKKDNKLHQIIKYNIGVALSVWEDIEKEKKIMYYYMENITFGIVRCYYVVFVGQADLKKNASNWQYLAEVSRFVTERKENIFVKLYNRKVVKILMLLEQIRLQDISQQYQQIHITQQDINRLQNQVKSIKQFVISNQNNLSEDKFTSVYTKIEDTLIKVHQLLKADQHQQEIKDIHKQLLQLQAIAIKSFVFGEQSQSVKGSVAGDMKSDKAKTDKAQQRRYLKPRQPHTKQSYPSPDKRSQKSNNPSNYGRMTEKSNMQQLQPGKDKGKQDMGQDIFLPNPFNTAPTSQQTLRIVQLQKNQGKLLQECKQFLGAVMPEYGQQLEDAKNFNIQQLVVLLEAIKKYNINKEQKKQVQPPKQPQPSPQKPGKQGSQKSGQKPVQPPPPPQPSPQSIELAKVSQLVVYFSKNLINPQLSQKQIPNMLSPKIRISPLKQYHQKLTQLLYKVTKSSQPQSPQYPPNITQYIHNRKSLLNLLNTVLQPIYKISSIITSITFLQKYSISSQQTYQIFLKMLLAEKQVQIYQMAFKDRKNVRKDVRDIVVQGVYGGFLDSLKKMMPGQVKDVKGIGQMVEEIDFFVDFCVDTDDIVGNFVKDLQGFEKGNKNQIERQKREVGRVLTKWAKDAAERVMKKRQGLDYQRAEQQLSKINQIIRICNNANRTQITDKTALQIIKLLDQKI